MGAGAIRSNPYHWPEKDWQEFTAWRESVPADPGADLEVADGVEEGRVDGDTVEEPVAVDHIAAAATDLYVDRAVLDEIVELLEDKRQVVLYGPPGTGQTFVALRLARAIVGDDLGRRSVVQFHPATSYEDFFEGLRPG